MWIFNVNKLDIALALATGFVCTAVSPLLQILARKCASVYIVLRESYIHKQKADTFFPFFFTYYCSLQRSSTNSKYINSETLLIRPYI